MTDWPVRRSPLDWALLPYRRYAEFSGRSTRSEYWWFTALFALVIAVTSVLVWLAGVNIAALVSQQDPVRAEQVFVNPLASLIVALFSLYFIGSLVPSLALAIRRLHDIGFSGWWYLGNTVASALPVVGIVFKGIYIGYMCRDGMIGPNRFGPDPKARQEIDLFA
jgi:uncharacterized membrane protein YhaH (DUF805 family)